MKLVIEAFGETELSRELIRFSHAADNMRPAFEEVHESFLALEQKQFDTQGSLSGGWQPLAASTVAGKKAAGLDPRIMFRTGRLADSLTKGESDDHVFTVTPDSVYMGSKVPYGVYHQSRAERTRLPRRPLVVLSAEVKQEWVKMIQRHLIEGGV